MCILCTSFSSKFGRFISFVCYESQRIDYFSWSELHLSNLLINRKNLPKFWTTSSSTKNRWLICKFSVDHNKFNAINNYSRFDIKFSGLIIWFTIKSPFELYSSICKSSCYICCGLMRMSIMYWIFSMFSFLICNGM